MCNKIGKCALFIVCCVVSLFVMTSLFVVFSWLVLFLCLVRRLYLRELRECCISLLSILPVCRFVLVFCCVQFVCELLFVELWVDST